VFPSFVAKFRISNQDTTKMKKIGFFWSVLLLNFASFGQTHSTDIAYKSENTSAAFPGGDFELMIFINDNY
jgi:hypothetical protein